MSNATKNSIDFTCQFKDCIELSTHGTVIDDRWHQETIKGDSCGWHFKPKELVIGCEKHWYGLLRRCVLGVLYKPDIFLITSNREDEWLKEIESGDLVVHGKFG